MIDTKSINLLDLIGRDTELKKAANTGGGEYHGACPFCGGVDRFAVQPNGRGWSCRQCSPHWQDAIAYVMRRDGVQFRQAVETLGIPLDQQPRRPHVQRPAPDAPQALHNDYLALNDAAWQDGALDFYLNCSFVLWERDGARAMDYLLKRGLTRDVIAKAGLGFNTADVRTKWGETEIFLPRGIVIPWQINGQIWKVNIRRPVDEPKYLQATGGANGLYNADAIRPDATVVLVEGEFDALVMAAHVPGVIPVATGTTSGARAMRWVSALSLAGQVVVAYDADELTNEGVQKAVQWWMKELGSKAVRLMPTAHDVTDMWKAGQDLQAWLAPYSLCFSRPLTAEMEARRQAIREDMFTQGYKLAEVVHETPAV